MKRSEFNLFIMDFCRANFKRGCKEWSKTGLTKGQPMILDFLCNNNGCIQREIAERCNIEAATATKTLGIMERDGLIRREPDLNDRRVLHVWLTEKGIEKQRDIQRVLSIMGEVCLNGFSKEEEELLISFIKRMINNMETVELREDEDV